MIPSKILAKRKPWQKIISTFMSSIMAITLSLDWALFSLTKSITLWSDAVYMGWITFLWRFWNYGSSSRSLFTGIIYCRLVHLIPSSKECWYFLAAVGTIVACSKKEINPFLRQSTNIVINMMIFYVFKVLILFSNLSGDNI